MKSGILATLAALWALPAFGQATLQQGGSTSAGHLPIYWSAGSQQPIVIDAGPAGGNLTGQGVGEFNQTNRTTAGTGPNGEHSCWQSANSNAAGGYYALCMDSSQSGKGLISYGAFAGKSPQDLVFKVNGLNYTFPFTSGSVIGPGSSVVGHQACWNNTAGTLLSDCGAALTIGGTNTQIQFNNAGALGGFTLGGDATVNTGTGALTITKIGNVAVTLGGAMSTAGTFTTAGAVSYAGAFNQTFTATNNFNATFPTGSFTVASLTGTEALTNKTYNGLTINSTTGTLAITNGKTFTTSNTLQITGTDGSTLNVGTGGTLGTAAYTATSAYVPSATQIAAALGADVLLNNTGNYFDGPSVAQGSTGTWFASGTVTAYDPGAAAEIYCKLWDGSTVISSASFTVNPGGGGTPNAVSLSGFLATPAGNIRISCRDVTATTGKLLFNQTGNSRDSKITAFRVN